MTRECKRTHIDLHIHTNASDSSRTLQEVLKIAEKNKVDIISITDHNTVDAYKKIVNPSKVFIIPGVELTAVYNNIQLHILGYGINVNNTLLNQKLQSFQYSYLRTLYRMITRIDKEFGINIKRELELRALKIKRKNICIIMQELTPIKKSRDIYEKYLNYKQQGMEVTYFNVEEAISLILEAGGVPVLAHPQRTRLSEEELEDMIIELKQMGLLGIEVYHPSQIGYEEKYLDLAKKYSFLISGGSDDHGINTPKTIIGFVGDKKIEITDISILERLGYKNERL